MLSLKEWLINSFIAQAFDRKALNWPKMTLQVDRYVVTKSDTLCQQCI